MCNNLPIVLLRNCHCQGRPNQYNIPMLYTDTNQLTSLEVVNKFCYLGDMISAGRVEENILVELCCWKKFR